MNIRTEFLSILLIAVCIICNRATKLPHHVSIKDTTCDCPNTELISEGGFADKYPRYMGVWVNVGDYHDQPMYRCLQGCSALTDKLVSLWNGFDVLYFYTNYLTNHFNCNGKSRSFCFIIGVSKRRKWPDNGTLGYRGLYSWRCCILRKCCSWNN